MRFLTQSLVWLAFAAGASACGAKGIDCTRARSPTELAICGDPSLRALDAQLAELYAQAQGLPDRSPVATSQRQWLARRNQCGNEMSCLRWFHATRIAQLQAFVAYQPDATDTAALATLRDAVETRLTATPEFALERALAALSLGAQLSTTFSHVTKSRSAGPETRAPTPRPAGVSISEWRAFQRSRIDDDGEAGVDSVTLLDLDGDGQRDLILTSREEGTGLFTYTSLLRRQGSIFVGKPYAMGGDIDTAFYSLSGRGGHQSVHWVQLHGRVYAAYLNGRYGEDRVYLLRPWRDRAVAPLLSVQYRYTLSVPREQTRDESKPQKIVLDADLHSALAAALSKVPTSIAREATQAPAPLCPAPRGATPDQVRMYGQFGDSHYSFEVVSDFPVRLGDQCRPGRLVAWFGSYGPFGLGAQLWLKQPRDDTLETFEVRGHRRVLKLETVLDGVFDAW